MSLIEIKAEPGLLRQLVEVLTRLADGIDRAYPPAPTKELRAKLQPKQPEDLIVFQPEEEAWREEEEETRKREGWQ